MPSHTCVCPPAGFAQPPWPNPARNILRLGFRARDHFDIWAKSGPCPASYEAVHGWAELVADHATAGFGLPMAQTPLLVAGGMRCRCSIVSILGFPKLGSRSLLLGPAPGEKWSCARLLTKPRSGDGVVHDANSHGRIALRLIASRGPEIIRRWLVGTPQVAMRLRR